MPVKHADARTWRDVKTSPDGLRWSAWPRGNRPEVNSQFALRFPSNLSASDQTAPYAVLQFLNPQNAGLGLWGAGNTAGVTLVYRVKYYSQSGYYALHWYSRTDGNFDGANILAPYWGGHPYPSKGYDNSAFVEHIWELATAGLDVIDGSGTNWASGMNSASPPVTTGVQVEYDRVYVQGIRITRNSANSVTLRHYYDLPDTAKVLVYTDTRTGIGNATIGSGLLPGYTIGDSPWWASTSPQYQHERASCDYDAQKTFAADIGEADMLAEASSFTSINTSAGQAAIWFGRNGFDAGSISHGGSILCHYGTGRALNVIDAGGVLELVGRI